MDIEQASYSVHRQNHVAQNASSCEDLPVEILLQIFCLATGTDDLKSLEIPLINWHSEGILFARSRKLRRESLATKASIARVSRFWNELAIPALYEHLVVKDDGALGALSHMMDPSSQKGRDLARNAKRLDLEFAQLSNASPAPLLASLPNLRTLVMLIPGFDSDLLNSIPSGLERLYWKSPSLSVSGTPNPKRPMSQLFAFLDSHPRLQTISFPEPFAWIPIGQLPRTPFLAVREWILRSEWELMHLLILGAGHQLLPNVRSRHFTALPNNDYHMKLLLSGKLRWSISQPAPFTFDDISPNPSTMTLSLTIWQDPSFPLRFLHENLPLIAQLAPHLQELNLTILSGLEDSFSISSDAPSTNTARLPSVTTISVQRLLDSSELQDPVGTLHHTIKRPWRDAFPSLEAIRIRDDIDLEQVIQHPTMAFVRDEGWNIRVEDRFGRALT